MGNRYQISEENKLNKEIEYNFDRAFSILKDLGIDVPDYAFYSDYRIQRR